MQRAQEKDTVAKTAEQEAKAVSVKRSEDEWHMPGFEPSNDGSAAMGATGGRVGHFSQRDYFAKSIDNSRYVPYVTNLTSPGAGAGVGVGIYRSNRQLMAASVVRVTNLTPPGVRVMQQSIGRNTS